MYRKSRGLGPRVVDHGWVTWSTVDQWQRRQEGAGARRCAHWSRPSGHSGARELTGGGIKWRAEHGGPISGLTKAQAALWWPGDSIEAAVERKLGTGSAQDLGEGEKRWDGCSENRQRRLPFIGVVRQ
jgi:hypothetical protein